jgi:hypothetical protein
VFGTFVDIAGDRYPSVGVGRGIVRTTIAELYHGDEAAFLAHDPGQLVHEPATRHVVAWFEVGRHDYRSHAVIPGLVSTMRRAGLPTRCTTTPGGHDWIAASHAVADSLPTLATALAAVAPGPP